MRKFKIFITVFLLYEFAILTILQVPDYCISFFNRDFCDIGKFRYFLFGVMIPGMLGLFWWWLPDIAKVFCKKCQCDNNQNTSSFKDVLQDVISKQEIERLISAAVIMGIQKFFVNHPKAKETINNILKVVDTTQKKLND